MSPPVGTEHATNSENNDHEPQNSAENEVVTHINSISCSTLLQVTMVNIHGPNGVISAPALLDGGSTISMISSSLATRVGLHGRKQTLRIRGAWDDTELVCEAELVDLTVSNKHGRQFSISARSVNKLEIPTQNFNMVNLENYPYLQKVKHELICNGTVKPEVLIGQDNRHLLKPIQTLELEGDLDSPCATLTPLGWCLHGRVPRPRAHRDLMDDATTMFITEIPTEQDLELRDLHETVRRSFTIDSMEISTSKPRQNMEDQRALDYLEQTSELVDGKWHVGLPWKDANCVMPDTRPMALMRLKGVENKMKKDSKYAQRFKERIQHLLGNDYAEECKNCDLTPKTWYLPIFGVDNPNKSKLRLVYDAAARYLGLSLNDYLLKGPDLLMSLFGIMLRFRENKIAVIGDIKDMFMRVKIRPEDRNAFRFLFRGNPKSPTTHKNSEKNCTQISTENEEPIKTYVMSSLIFGANCSPFIAQFIKNKNARRFESTMPAAAHAIYTQHYMDDYIDSLPDEETAVNLAKEISFIHSQGNFEIRNWNSNSKVVLDSLPKEALGTAAVKFKLGQQYEGDRTLGLIWRTDDDSLGFDISFKKIPENIINGKQRPTKREILRVVMSIFDVFGFLSPFTINGKLILQETWRLKINWDDPITDEIYSKWQDWINMLHSLRNVRLPRYYPAATWSASETESGPTSRPSHSHLQQTDPATRMLRTVAVVDPPPPCPAPTQPLQASDTAHAINCYRNLQMHIFCDSSTKAFCAVAYWRWIHNENNTRIAFIASKCRVAGIKPITIPRLELQAALLAARLANTITKEHKMTAERRYFWSDSTTVLHWIRNNARNYEIYVANRLGEIDELTQMDEWRYIPTKMNVADLATRECFDCSMLQQEWLYGPTFLQSSENEWPRDVLSPATDIPTIECVTAIQNADCTLPVPEPKRFSSWLRLRRTMMRVLEFIQKAKRAIINNLHKESYNCDEHLMEKAEHILIRHSQLQSFGSEITLLKNSKTIPTSSKLLTLSPFLDEHGVLRADGRIDAADDVTPETKKPIILDGQDYITRLIVRHYHVIAAHGNQEMVVNELKQKYWIIRLRPTVKNVVSKCMFCRLRKCKPEIPRIGDLPKARMAHHQRPFLFCGVDLFGPMTVTVGRRHERRYGVLFTCLTVRAIHIEVVHNLTTDSFIMALRRFANRRGWPAHMFSDNGTNLRGADAELKKSINELDQRSLTDEAFNSGYGTRWTFIPPVSPHWGGAWERLIRSVKTSLKAVLRERAPRDEALATLLAEVENIVNSRPLTHVSVEAGSTESLTPNHFLLGTSSNMPQIGTFDDTDLYLRKQWRISQRLADLYWNRWVKEVLPEMIPRKKWNKENRPLQVGDVVVIVDSDGPRNTWPKGLIVEVNPGRDGRVRMVKIKTKTGFLTRSATRVARIPIVDECC